MYQKGSITVYLSLTLAILTALIGTALYSVQCAGARVQAVHGTDQGLYSLFARYDIPMLERSVIPFAPANCAQEVKDWGARVLCHCNDGVIGDIVEILDRAYQ